VNNGTDGVAQAQGNVLANDTDVDAYDTKVVTQVGSTTVASTGETVVNGTYGALTIHADGSYTYTLNNGAEATQKLGATDTAHDVFSYVVTDAHGLTSSSSLDVTVNGSNDVTVVDLNGSANGRDVSTTAVEQLGQQFASQATLSDIDSSTLQSMTLTLAHNLDGTAETLSLDAVATAAAAGLTVSYTNGALSITGSASVGTYQKILQNVVYTNTSDNPDASIDRTVTVVVNDGHDNSAAQIATIKVQPINDAPALAGTLAAHVTEGLSHILTSAELGYTDPDNTASQVVFKVSSLTHGTITNGGAPATSFTAAELAAGKIAFVHDGSEGSTASFQVKVEDGNQDNSVPTASTFNFTVDAVNDGKAALSISDTTQQASAPKVGDILHANLGNDPDGAATGVTYHWLRDGADTGNTGVDYTLVAADAGHALTVKATYTDGQNFAETVTSAATATVVSANYAPVGTNAAVDIVEDVSHTFAVSEFGFRDADNDGFAGVVIKGLPSSSSGILLYANVAVTVGQTITAADIAAGMLVYVPKDNLVNTWRDTYDTSFSFQVKDSTGSVSVTENEIELDLSRTDYQDDAMRSSDNNFSYNLTAGTEGSSHASVSGSNASSDSVELLTSAGTKFLSFDIERAGDNLELSWTTSNGERSLTMLNQFDSALRVEKFGFDGGGSFAGYNLGTNVYTIASGLAGSNANDLIAGSGAKDTISGGNGNDLIFGGGGNDTISGGDGNDLLVGGAGADRFVWGNGALGSGSADVIADYSFAEGDKIDLQNLVDKIAAGKSISDYIRIFDTGSVLQVQVYVSVNHTGWTTAYTLADARTNGTDSVRIHAAGQDYVFKDDGSVAVSAIDPIILDLDHNGIALTTLDNGVSFDINADGHQDKIAWTAGTDGILAYDVDGNGKIDNGSEIFSPHFAGGSYVDGLAALATLDSNHDGKIDATDEAFSKLTIWQDLNHNGISDAGELSSLADHQIASLSLDASASNTDINGQSVLADGSYTLTDGSAGHFVEVAFDTALGGSDDHAYALIGSDGDDILSGAGGMYTLTGGAGADTFVLDTNALADVKLADVITDYKAGEGDTLDVSKLLDSLLGHEATEAEALSSVKTTVTGADTTVSVNANGGWHDVAVLQNTTEAVKILFDDKHDAVTAPHVG
jgi:VCBS repeat-containing protein